MNANRFVLRALPAVLASSMALATMIAPQVARAADPEPGGTSAEDTKVLDERLKQYWPTEVRDIETLQKRLYRKEDRFEFEIYSGFIPNDQFYDYYPLGLRAGMFFSEDLGAELWGSYLIAVNSALEDFLETNFQSSLQVTVTQSLQWLAGANLLWSPLHGKLGFLTEKLAHFDLTLAFGVGAIGTTVRDPGKELSKVSIGGNVGLGFRFFFNDTIALRFDYRQFFYSADAGGLSHPVELTIGVSFFTASPE